MLLLTRSNVFRNGFRNTVVLLLRNLATDCLPRACLYGNSFSISLPSNDYKRSSYYWARLREMFIVPIPSYTRYNTKVTVNICTFLLQINEIMNTIMFT
jgi:hypothetical protein